MNTLKRVGPVSDVMRFHLIYSGPLSASGNKSKAQEAAAIRGELSGQLRTLWNTHHSLQVLKLDGARHQSGGIATGYGGWSKLRPREVALNDPDSKYTDLLPPIEVAGTEFLPLVRKSLDLNCELDILFLRQEDPGALITKGGDVDNRIKTLLDALRMPSPEEQRRIPTPGNDLHCLMESDALVSRLNVDTDRLLFPQGECANEVHLVIGVTVNVLVAGPHNICLL